MTFWPSWAEPSTDGPVVERARLRIACRFAPQARSDPVSVQSILGLACLTTIVFVVAATIGVLVFQKKR